MKPCFRNLFLAFCLVGVTASTAYAFDCWAILRRFQKHSALDHLKEYLKEFSHQGVELTPKGLGYELVLNQTLFASDKKLMGLVLRAVREGSVNKLSPTFIESPEGLKFLNLIRQKAVDEKLTLQIFTTLDARHLIMKNDGSPESSKPDFDRAISELGLSEARLTVYNYWPCSMVIDIKNGKSTVTVVTD